MTRQSELSEAEQRITGGREKGDLALIGAGRSAERATTSRTLERAFGRSVQATVGRVFAGCFIGAASLIVVA